MTDKYFSARVLEDMATNVQQNLRDLANPALRVFYPEKLQVSDEELAERVARIIAFREKNGLTPMSRGSATSAVAGPGSSDLFRTVLENCGIESEFENDLIEAATPESVIIGAAFARFVERQTKKGTRLSLADIKTRLAAMGRSIPPASLHLTEAPQIPIPDEDNRVNEAKLAALQYVKAYLRLGE